MKAHNIMDMAQLLAKQTGVQTMLIDIVDSKSRDDVAIAFPALDENVRQTLKVDGCCILTFDNDGEALVAYHELRHMVLPYKGDITGAVSLVESDGTSIFFRIV